jgi:hypothetical protein
VNAFNRLVLLILALLLFAVPVVLLLIYFGTIPADVVNQYTGYRYVIRALGGFSASDLTTVTRTVSTVMEGTPGRETVITANAVKTLAESAAREVGAESPSASLASDKDRYVVFTGIEVPPSGNYTELAARVRENIMRVLGDQGVPVKDVEVTVRGTAS